MRRLERRREDGHRFLHTAVLLVLLMVVAKAAAPALEEGAVHRILGPEAASIPHQLDSAGTAASCNARDGLATAGVADLLVDLRSGAGAAAVVEEAERALRFEESGLPVSLCECSGHGCRGRRELFLAAELKRLGA